MWKKVLAVLIVFAFLFTGVANAEIPINYGSGDLVRKLNTAFESQIAIVGNKEGVTVNVSGESNLTSAALSYAVIQLADTGALDGADCRYISLADGVPGQMLTIQLLAATAGTLYITDDQVAAGVMTKTGWDDIAFNAALDSVTLLYVDDTIGWIIVGGNSVTIT